MKKDNQAAGSNIQDPKTLSRRDFFANTAVIGAGLVIWPLSWAASSDLPNESNKMKVRKLGKLEVSEIGAGCMSISANYGAPASKAEGIKLIRTAHEKGVTFFDTAEVYGDHIQAKSLSEKRSHRFARRSLSPQNLVTTTRKAAALLIVNQSTSGKWLRNH